MDLRAYGANWLSRTSWRAFFCSGSPSKLAACGILNNYFWYLLLIGMEKNALDGSISAYEVPEIILIGSMKKTPSGIVAAIEVNTYLNLE